MISSPAGTLPVIEIRAPSRVAVRSSEEATGSLVTSASSSTCVRSSTSFTSAAAVPSFSKCSVYVSTEPARAGSGSAVTSFQEESRAAGTEVDAHGESGAWSSGTQALLTRVASPSPV